jgi:NAD(P)-dependent dehydrogenase (short-subunit alcohol dehydrogenase family)
MEEYACCSCACDEQQHASTRAREHASTRAREHASTSTILLERLVSTDADVVTLTTRTRTHRYGRLDYLVNNAAGNFMVHGSRDGTIPVLCNETVWHVRARRLFGMPVLILWCSEFDLILHSRVIGSPDW